MAQSFECTCSYLSFLNYYIHFISFYSGSTISGALAVARYLCRVVPECGLYGKTALEKAEVWYAICRDVLLFCLWLKTVVITIIVLARN